MSEEKEFVPQQVVCPGCGQSYHETTPFYDPNVCAHGKMFVLRKAYGVNGANWSTFAADESIRHSDLCCPGCGASYTNGGNSVRLRGVVVDKIEQIALENAQADADEEVIAHRSEVEAAANEAGPAEMPEPDGAQIVNEDVLPELTDEDDDGDMLPADAEVRDEPVADASPRSKVKTLRIGG